MWLDRLNQLEQVFRERAFPENTSFNLCYFRSDFIEKDDKLKLDADGDLYDNVMEVKMHVNGEQAPTDWCGTVACVAGVTIMLFSPEYWNERIRAPFEEEARLLLELTEEQASELFIPYKGPDAWEKVTPEEVADVIRHLSLTGVSDWSVIRV